MTRPVCDARTAAWAALSYAGQLRTIYPKEGPPTDPTMRPVTLILCPRPDGCGAAAGEECRSPECCGECGGYLTGETDRCVCDDAKPRVDVGALLAELAQHRRDAELMPCGHERRHQWSEMYRGAKAYCVICRLHEEDAEADAEIAAMTAEHDRVRGILGARDGETTEGAARRARAWESIAEEARRITEATVHRERVDTCADEARTLVRDLRDVGASVTPHLWEGRCPDDITPSPDQRDPKCPACAVLLRADAMVGGAA